MSNRHRQKDPRPWRVGKSEKQGTNRFLRRLPVEEPEVIPHKKKAPKKPRKYRGCGGHKSRPHVEGVAENIYKWGIIEYWVLRCTVCQATLGEWSVKYWRTPDTRNRPKWLPDHVPGGIRD